jgi:hypothetical protein
MIKSSDIVYIAGPMTGKRLFNFPKFFGMAGIIKKVYGCEVLNPARQPEGLEYEEYLFRAMSDLSHATVVVLLDGWIYSHGANLEYRKAQKRGIRMITESEILEVMNNRLKYANPGTRIGEMSHD